MFTIPSLMINNVARETRTRNNNKKYNITINEDNGDKKHQICGEKKNNLIPTVHLRYNCYKGRTNS